MIDDVEVKQARDLSPRDIEHDNPEFRRLEETLGFMRQIYGREIDPEETVTVIRFSQRDRAAAARSSATARPRRATEAGVAVEYRFLTTWLLESPRERVWDAIYDQSAWPSWWRGVEDVVELGPGDETGSARTRASPGARGCPTTSSSRSTDARSTSRTCSRPRPSASWTGTGRWRLFEQDEVTAVLYEWNVATTKAWMNRSRRSLRPVFEWNHDWVMRNGGVGIAELLGCRLLARLSPSRGRRTGARSESSRLRS